MGKPGKPLTPTTQPRERIEPWPSEMRVGHDVCVMEHTDKTTTPLARRAWFDCAQDGFENVPFASVGGLEKRAAMSAPKWIAPQDHPEYLAAYRAAAAAQYGPNWMTCTFSWKHALQFGEESARV